MKLSSTTVRLVLASLVLLGLGAYFINASVSWYDTPEGKGYDSPGGIAEGRPILSSEESIKLIMAQKDKERWKDQLAVACFIASGVMALGAILAEYRIRQASRTGNGTALLFFALLAFSIECHFSQHCFAEDPFSSEETIPAEPFQATSEQIEAIKARAAKVRDFVATIENGDPANPEHLKDADLPNALRLIQTAAKAIVQLHKDIRSQGASPEVVFPDEEAVNNRFVKRAEYYFAAAAKRGFNADGPLPQGPTVNPAGETPLDHPAFIRAATSKVFLGEDSRTDAFGTSIDWKEAVGRVYELEGVTAESYVNLMTRWKRQREHDPKASFTEFLSHEELVATMRAGVGMKVDEGFSSKPGKRTAQHGESLYDEAMRRIKESESQNTPPSSSQEDEVAFLERVLSQFEAPSDADQVRSDTLGEPARQRLGAPPNATAEVVLEAARLGSGVSVSGDNIPASWRARGGDAPLTAEQQGYLNALQQGLREPVAENQSGKIELSSEEVGEVEKALGRAPANELVSTQSPTMPDDDAAALTIAAGGLLKDEKYDEAISLLLRVRKAKPDDAAAEKLLKLAIRLRTNKQK